MGAFAAHLVVLDNNPRTAQRTHASLQNTESFVYVLPAAPGPPASIPAQQIVIVSSSICEVSFGGR